jgi:hypothetical protein
VPETVCREAGTLASSSPERIALRHWLRPALSAFPFVDKLQERLGLGVARAELQRLIKIGSRTRQIGLVQQMINAPEQVIPRVQRPHTHDAFGDSGGLANISSW